MVMQIGADVETSLKLTMTYDDNSMQTKVFSVGDFISVDFNKDGLRRTVCGTVNAIHADPYNGRLSRKDWYIVLHSDATTKYECGFVGALKIRVLEMIDLTVLTRARQITYVNSPNDETNISDIRFFEDKFQISQNDGASWITIGVAVEKEKEDAQNDLIKKISELIAADREGVTDQLINAIAALIDGETAKELWLHHHHHCHHPIPPKDKPEDLIAKLTELIAKLESQTSGGEGTTGGETDGETTDPTPTTPEVDPEKAAKQAEIDALIAKLSAVVERAEALPEPPAPPSEDKEAKIDELIAKLQELVNKASTEPTTEPTEPTEGGEDGDNTNPTPGDNGGGNTNPDDNQQGTDPDPVVTP